MVTTTSQDVRKKVEELTSFVTEQNDVITAALEKEKVFIREQFAQTESKTNAKIDEGITNLKDYIEATAQEMTRERM